MSKPKIHMRYHPEGGWTGSSTSQCGLYFLAKEFLTEDPKEVTCKSCLRSKAAKGRAAKKG